MKLKITCSVLLTTLLLSVPALAQNQHYSTVLGAPVNSHEICEKNLPLIQEASLNDGEKVVEASCKSVEILNTDSGDVETKYQPSILIHE